jgi:hypothetical protein
MMTMTRSKRTTDNDNTMPSWALPNPKAKKKTKEDTLDESLEETEDAKNEKTANDPIAVANLVSQFDSKAVAGTTQLWKQPILLPTSHWKNIQIEGELTGFCPTKSLEKGTLFITYLA